MPGCALCPFLVAGTFLLDKCMLLLYLRIALCRLVYGELDFMFAPIFVEAPVFGASWYVDGFSMHG